MSDTVAFVATDEGLSTFRFDAPNRLTALGAGDRGDPVSTLDYMTGWVFAAAGPKGLQAFDVSDPARPTLRGEILTPGEATGVDVRGGMAYVTWTKCPANPFPDQGCGGGLDLIFVLDPLNMFLVGRTDQIGGATSVTFSEDDAFVYVGWNNCGFACLAGLAVVDVQDPRLPRVVGNTAMVTSGTDVIAVRSGDSIETGPWRTAYLAGEGGDGEVTLVNVLDRSNPVVQGVWETPGSARGFAFQSQYTVFVADGEAGLFKLQLAGFPLVRVARSGLRPRSVPFANGVFMRPHTPHVFVAGGDDGLQVYDASSDQPMLLAQAPVAGFARQVLVTDIATVTPTPTATATGTPTATATYTPEAACADAAKSISEATYVAAGETFAIDVAFSNIGTCPWLPSEGYSLRLVGGEAFGAAATRPLLQRIDPGRFVRFRIEMRAPGQPGTYLSDWALMHGATQIGNPAHVGEVHSHLIVVKERPPDVPEPCRDGAEGESSNITQPPGTAFTGRVTVRNTGTCVWKTNDGYRLKPNNADVLGANRDQPLLQRTDAGSSYTFEIPMSTGGPGEHRTEWVMMHNDTPLTGVITLRVSVGSSGGGGGGPCRDSASWGQTTGLIPLKTGQAFFLETRLRNTGQCTWSPGTGHRLSSVGSTDFGAKLPKSVRGSVGPGSDAVFYMVMRAPDIEGQYTARWTFGAPGGPVLATMELPFDVGRSQPDCTDEAELVDQSPGSITLDYGERREVFFQLRNTGTCVWNEAGDYAIQYIGQPAALLGAETRRRITGAFPRPQQLRYAFTMQAPDRGLRGHSTWQLHHGGKPFGPVMNIDVSVVPGGGGDGPAKKIAVLVHGFSGFWIWPGPEPIPHSCSENPVLAVNPGATEFGRVGAALSEAGYEVWLAHYTSSYYLGTPLFDVNARCLRSQLDFIFDRVDATRVTLVAHSMGGIVSRAYMEGAHYKDNVDRLITLGTPHRGLPDWMIDAADFMDWVRPRNRKCQSLPIDAVCQLKQSYLTQAFPASQQLPGVRYDVIGGNADAPATRRAYGGEDNDAVISVHSAARYLSGDRVHNWVTPASHAELKALTTTPTYFAADSTYRCVKGLVAQGTGVGGCNLVSPYRVAAADSLGSSITAEATGVAALPVRRGTLRPGDIARLPMVVDGSQVDFRVQHDLTATALLVLPDNRIVNANSLADALPGAERTVLEHDQTRVTIFSIPDPPLGEWQVVLVNAAVAPGDARYVVTGQQASAIALAVGDMPSVLPLEAVEVTAKLSAVDVSLTDAIVTGQLIGAPGDPQLRLLPAANGSYRGLVTGPASAGTYDLRVTARGYVGSTRFERETEQPLFVRVPRVLLRGQPGARPLDIDSNGRFDALAVDLPLQVAQAGSYQTVALLQSSDGTIISRQVGRWEWLAGGVDATVEFPGLAISAAGSDGPYAITLRVADADTYEPFLDEDPLLLTSDYRAREFEVPSAGGAEQRVLTAYLPSVLRNDGPRPGPIATATMPPQPTPTPGPSGCGIDDTEPNDDFARARELAPLCPGRQLTGSLASGDDSDVFRVVVPQVGVLAASLSGLPVDGTFDFLLLDSNGINAHATVDSSPTSKQLFRGVPAGEYYLSVHWRTGARAEHYRLVWSLTPQRQQAARPSEYELRRQTDGVRQDERAVAYR